MQGSLTSDLLEGILDEEREILTGHRNDIFGVNQRLRADIRAGQQGFATARQAQELLRIEFTRHGPQPRPAASGQDNDLHRSSSFSRLMSHSVKLLRDTRCVASWASVGMKATRSRSVRLCARSSPLMRTRLDVSTCVR